MVQRAGAQDQPFAGALLIAGPKTTTGGDKDADKEEGMGGGENCITMELFGSDTCHRGTVFVSFAWVNGVYRIDRIGLHCNK